MTRPISEFRLRFIDVHDRSVTSARALIANSFRTRLGAFPKTEHQHFVVIERLFRAESTVVACTSITLGLERSLFSEQYLNSTIEQQITSVAKENIPRSKICEIGSLSTDLSFIPSVKDVIAYFPWCAYALGFDFALVTVTSYMRDSLKAANVFFQPFCKADQNCLSPSERLRWGRYYEFDPETGVLDLRQMNFLNGRINRTSNPHEFEINLRHFEKVEA